MKSQIPAAAVKYFEARHVDLAKEHPVVSATFGPKLGWVPVYRPLPVSHLLLVQLRERGIQAVQLTVNDYIGRPEFTIDELIGDMGPLDAEFADGIPVSEGSGVVGNTAQISEIMQTIGISAEVVREYLIQSVEHGEIKFIATKRDSGLHTALETWRYRLTPHGKNVHDEFTYELTVLAYEDRRVSA